MSQKASPTAIGAFVLGAVALIVTGLLVFGSGKFLKETETFILYFQGNAKGLNVGAPASFRGVTIGRVNDVELVFDNATAEIFIGVIVEVESDAFHEVDSQRGHLYQEHEDIPVDVLIQRHGLRAKLAMISLVTGQLYIDFDFFPDTPVHLAGFDKRHDEIPTLPSTMDELGGTLQRLVDNIEGLPIKDLVDQLLAMAESLNDLVESRKFKDTPEVLYDSLVNLRDLTDKLNNQITPMTSGVKQASEEATKTFQDMRTALRDDQENIVRLADSIEEAATQARILLGNSDQLVSAIDADKLDGLINELSEAARSIRVFADYLERHPEALIRGKN